MGFVIGKKTYLRDPFNVLDFIIAISSIVIFVFDRTISIKISFVKAFRALRALRPLRIGNYISYINYIYSIIK
jgi:hypothetical protein